MFCCLVGSTFRWTGEFFLPCGFEEHQTAAQLRVSASSSLKLPPLAVMSRFVLLGPAWTRAFRCVWMLEELGCNYRVADSMPASRRVKKYVSTGKVPVLLEYRSETTDDSEEEEPSFVLYESSAINTYLADRFQSNLAPSPLNDLQARAVYDQCVSCITNELDSQGLWIHRKHHAMAKFFGDIPPAVEHAKSQFDRINEHLALQLDPYLLGEDFSAADILYVHCLDWAKSIGWQNNDSDWATKVEAYRKLCHERPAYQRAKALRDANIQERRKDEKNRMASKL